MQEQSSRRGRTRSTLTLLTGMTLLMVATSAIAYEVTVVNNGGNVEGRVAFAGDDYPKPEKVRTTRDADTCGNSKMTQTFVVDAETGGLKNAVVQLVGVEAGKDFPEGYEAVVHQTECHYDPHVIILFDKKPIYVVNSDPILHNVHSYREDQSTVFNVAQPIQGQRTRLKMRGGPGVYALKCDIHAWMSAWVAVVDNPYVTITDEQGHYSIDNVPPGNYEVKIWHEGIGEGTKPVSVKAGEASTVEFVIGE